MATVQCMATVQTSAMPHRADIKLQPLRPGIVSEGPLPEGSRVPGRFSFSTVALTCRDTWQVGVTSGAKADGV